MTVPQRLRKRGRRPVFLAHVYRPFRRTGRSGILAQLPRLSATERRDVLNRLIELDEDAATLNELTSSAEECFLMLEAMEAHDAENDAR